MSHDIKQGIMATLKNAGWMRMAGVIRMEALGAVPE